MKHIKLHAFAISVYCLSFSTLVEGKVLQEWNFEDNNPLHNLTIEGSKPEIIPDPKDPSNKVMRAVLKPDQEREERSEVMPGAIKVGEDRWIGVRIMRPDPQQNEWNCFFQLGPIWGAPGKGRAGLYQLDTLGDAAWHFRGWMGRAGGKDFMKRIGPLKYGEWDDWVFHVKLRADDTGMVEVWRNGKSVLKHMGQNAFPGDTMRIKWGVYARKTEKEISALYDNVVIGDENSSYEEVAPKKAASEKAKR